MSENKGKKLENEEKLSSQCEGRSVCLTGSPREGKVEPERPRGRRRRRGHVQMSILGRGQGQQGPKVTVFSGERTQEGTEAQCAKEKPVRPQGKRDCPAGLW